MITQNDVYDACRHYICENEPALGTDLTNYLIGLIRSRNYKGLADCDTLLSGQSYPLEVWRVIRQVRAFFSKNDIFTDAVIAEQNAWASFRDAEKRCRITNKRLDYYYVKRDRLDPDLNFLISRMERYIHSTLGPFAPFLERLPELVRITSGASATRSRRRALPPLKLSLKQECAPAAVPYILALSRLFGLEKVRCKTLNWNRVVTVPKSWKTNRTIACEPDGNIPLQLAFDSYVKEQLRSKTRINLSKQTTNQEMARIGSISGVYSTIDLKAASDTISFNTVQWLFPHDWLNYLVSTRSRFYRAREGTGEYAKFSSMGNGATFAIETLVFAAACYAVGSKEFVVYGDDIVIETELVAPLMRIMRFFGFVINTEKSFTEGPFRESCGKDYYQGVDITPFYIRSVSEQLPVLAHNLNGLASIGCPVQKRLWAFTRDIYNRYREKIPLVPFNGDTSSGLHISVTDCYRTKKLRTLRQEPWCLKYEALVAKASYRSFHDSRPLFLTYHDMFRHVEIRYEYGIEEKREFSRCRVPILSHKYVRKWVRWFPPPRVTPVYVYSYSEFILSPVDG